MKTKTKVAEACPATKTRVQCKACPWRTDVDPTIDIPNGYTEERHRALKETIAEPGSFYASNGLRMMACHEFKVGAEQVCVGWLANQLGPGNNIGLRLAGIMGKLPRYELVGEQHETFEDTLPKKRRRARKAR